MSMDWTPKPGEKVTSPLLVGEWEVVCRTDLDLDLWWVEHGGKRLLIAGSYLSPVAPPLATEPPVGSVVWAEGHYWIRDNEGVWCKYAADLLVCDSWESIGPDASPVVAVSQVADWLVILALTTSPTTTKALAEAVRERFGWPE